MQRVTVSETQTDLPMLIEAAVRGETVLMMLLANRGRQNGKDPAATPLASFTAAVDWPRFAANDWL